jgi:hypothetical protein
LHLLFLTSSVPQYSSPKSLILWDRESSYLKAGVLYLYFPEFWPWALSSLRISEIYMFFLSVVRSLIANLSAANCYKSEHLKKPENWALGMIYCFELLWTLSSDFVHRCLLICLCTVYILWSSSSQAVQSFIHQKFEKIKCKSNIWL